jgi:hypothetical protein
MKKHGGVKIYIVYVNDRTAVKEKKLWRLGGWTGKVAGLGWPRSPFSYYCFLVVRRRPRHRCRVYKDILMLKIEPSVKRQNDQKQKEQFTFVFQKNS